MYRRGKPSLKRETRTNSEIYVLIIRNIQIKKGAKGIAAFVRKRTIAFCISTKYQKLYTELCISFYNNSNFCVLFTSHTHTRTLT